MTQRYMCVCMYVTKKETYCTLFIQNIYIEEYNTYGLLNYYFLVLKKYHIFI